MAGQYLPPQMHESTESASSEVPSVKAERKPEDGYTLDEISKQYSFRHKGQLGTMNRASKFVNKGEKHTIGFVIVFEGQHPRWPPLIYCKKKLYLLPRADALPSAPFTVFTEISNPRTSKDPEDQERLFLYAGAHTITEIHYLMPRTPRLIKLLESKFTGPKSEGSEKSFNRFLNMLWAVVELTKVKGEEDKGKNPMEPPKEINLQSDSKLLEEIKDKVRLQESGAENQNGKPGLEGDKKEVQGDEEVGNP